MTPEERAHALLATFVLQDSSYLALKTGMAKAFRDVRDDTLEKIIEFSEKRAAYHRSENPFNEGNVITEAEMIALHKITEAKIIGSRARALKYTPQDKAEEGR